MKAIIALLAALLCSCEINKYEAISHNGNIVREQSYVMGSTYSTRRSDGSSRVFDGQDSFRSAAAVASAVVAGAINVRNTSTNAATDRYNTAAGVAAKPPTIITNTGADGTVTQTAIPFVPPKQP